MNNGSVNSRCTSHFAYGNTGEKHVRDGSGSGSSSSSSISPDCDRGDGHTAGGDSMALRDSSYFLAGSSASRRCSIPLSVNAGDYC